MSRNLTSGLGDVLLGAKLKLANSILEGVCLDGGYDYCLVLTSKDDPHEKDYIYTSVHDKVVSQVEIDVDPTKLVERWQGTINETFGIQEKETKKKETKQKKES